MLRYDECKNNNNKDFRSYPEMTVQVVLMKFYGGIYVFDSLTLKILMWGRFGLICYGCRHNPDFETLNATKEQQKTLTMSI